METSRLLNARLIQNFHLVWLDESINDAKNNYQDYIMQLRKVVNTINVFTSIDGCIDFITDIQEKAFIIISSGISQTNVSIVKGISQVSQVYILSGNNAIKDKKPDEWCKKITFICQELKQATQICDDSCASFSFIQNDETIDQNLDTLDCSFMYTQILKDILLTIKFGESHINEFLAYCREHIARDDVDLKIFDQIEKEYQKHRPIWWYTSNYFLYSMVNKTLRTMEMEFIVNIGFFVRDLYNGIVALHAEQSRDHKYPDTFVVYRGQNLSHIDFDKMRKAQGGLLAFNNFLSTSRNQGVATLFAENIAANPDLMGVVFEINVNPSITSSLFADIQYISAFPEEEEILFSMHSVFRIRQVKPNEHNNRLLEVQLIPTDDNDPKLHALEQRIHEETAGHTGWFKIGELMRTLGRYDKAEQMFRAMLRQTNEENETSAIHNELGLIACDQGNYAQAFLSYEYALAIKQKTLPANHPSLATSYNNIGSVYFHMGEYSKALASYQQALAIRQETLPANHPSLANSYNNIGGVYSDMGEYSKALVSYQQALAIRQQTLPANHPDLATSYNNIGSVYSDMGEYSKALASYQQALAIRQQTLPANHPDLATSYNSIGSVYSHMGEYSKALASYQQALAIRQQTLPANHPDLATSYNNIGSVYSDMGEYSKALTSHQQALAIQQQTLPANHPDLATSYNNIGSVYSDMGEYSKALASYQQALAIRQQTLPANHPDLANSYNNIGSVYSDMGEYSKALASYQQALAIQQETLPANHPDLATSYNNIGSVYSDMGEYSKALTSHQQALAIRQQTLPANHPHLATSYNNIGSVYSHMSEYSKALTSYQQALAIQQETLPANHPDLATSYNNIGSVYSHMSEYSKALTSHQQALAIRQQTLPANHPSLATSYNNIGMLYFEMGDGSTGLIYLEHTLNILQNSVHPTHPHLAAVKNNIRIIKQTFT